MTSNALSSLNSALPEVEQLGAVLPSRGTPPKDLARVISRAQVVLLSSHFERYVYSANEEAVCALNGANVSAAALPIILKLQHSAIVVDELARVQWKGRKAHLKAFSDHEAWLWSGATGKLRHEPLVAWMKAPKPKSLERYFQLWGVHDIFAAITRTGTTRSRLRLEVQELVDTRNNIAHGDFSAQATQSDVRRYVSTVKVFSSRVDQVLARRVRALIGTLPW